MVIPGNKKELTKDDDSSNSSESPEMAIRLLFSVTFKSIIMIDISGDSEELELSSSFVDSVLFAGIATNIE